MYIKINGKDIQADKGETILGVCKRIGIDIPTFCHDDRIEPVSSCRICVVEINNSPKLSTSCSTKIAEGMDIQTHSERVVEARRDVLKLNLMNHPNDCLTCKDSGKCKLQKYSYEYDVKHGEYPRTVPVAAVDSTNPFYIYDQNKCVKCGKCIRICKEIQHSHAIQFNHRGINSVVGSEFDGNLEESACVSCGNCVNECPTGALEVKSKDKYRLNETTSVESTCGYCGVGCRVDLRVKGNKIVEIKPVDKAPNYGSLCVKGRFGFNFLSHPDRLTTPLIRKSGKLEKASWDEALDLITEKMKDIKDEFTGDAIVGFSSARATTEENYLFQKLFRAGLGTNNVDHCARL